MIITNSILWYNGDSTQIHFPADTDPTTSISHTNIKWGTWGISFDESYYNIGTLYSENIIDEEPMFVDTANGDYHLLASSHCINSGHPDSLDSDGTRLDMGAYPYLNSYSGPTWYISENGNDITATGASDDHFRSIQAGINFSSDADSITVAAGTYVENINFRGRNIKVAGADRETTIIDGDSSASVVEFKNWEDTTAVLSGFTLQNGYCRGGYSGGGIKIHDASPTLTNLIIRDNYSVGSGGGVDIYASASRNTNIIK